MVIWSCQTPQRLEIRILRSGVHSTAVKAILQADQQTYHSSCVITSLKELVNQERPHVAMMDASKAAKALGKVVGIPVPHSLVRSAALWGCTRLSENEIPVER
jgi:hypothetical protein